MFKKLLIGAGAVAGLGALAFGTSLLSYVETGFDQAREAVQSEVPLDFEISRARHEIEEIVPQIEHCMHVIAEQQYDIERREQLFAQHEDRLAGQKEAILALRGDLATGNSQFVYASRTYSAEDVRQDLARRFDRYKMSKETLARKQDVLAARRKALAANEEKLDNMLSVKKDLAVKLEDLEARLAAVRASETISNLQIDDSQLAEAMALIRQIDKRIGTREKMLANEGRFTGAIPVEIDQAQEDQVEDIAERVDSYFEEQDAAPIPAKAPAA